MAQVFKEALNVANIGGSAVVAGASATLMNKLFMEQRAFPDDIPVIGGTPLWLYYGIVTALSSGAQGAIIDIIPRFITDPVVGNIARNFPVAAKPVVTGMNMYVFDKIMSFVLGGGLDLMNFTPFMVGAGAELIATSVNEFVVKPSEVAVFGGSDFAPDMKRDLPLDHENIALTASLAGGFGLANPF